MSSLFFFKLRYNSHTIKLIFESIQFSGFSVCSWSWTVVIVTFGTFFIIATSSKAQQVKNPPAVQKTQETRVRSHIRKIPWRRKLQSTLVLSPGQSIPWTEDPGRLSSPEACKDSDMTEHAHTHTHSEPFGSRARLTLLAESTAMKVHSGGGTELEAGDLARCCPAKAGDQPWTHRTGYSHHPLGTPCSPAMWNFLGAFCFNISSLQMQSLWLSLRFLPTRSRKMAFSKKLCPGDFPWWSNG